MVENSGRDVVVAFALVAYMDETMINAHLELILRFVVVTLVLVKLFETL